MKRGEVIRLEKEAEKNMGNPSAIEEIVVLLNEGSACESVVSIVESGALITARAHEEYVRALVRLDRVEEAVNAAKKGISNHNNSHIMPNMINRSSSPSSSFSSSSSSSASSLSLLRRQQQQQQLQQQQQQQMDMTLGSIRNPLFIQTMEGTTKFQVFRALKFGISLGVAYYLFENFFDESKSSIAKGGPFAVITQHDVKPVAVTNVKFEDVKGADEAKEELEEIVHFLKDPKAVADVGAKLPKGVLLVGPPGTGKTLLGRAVAGEAGVPFFYASGSEFDEMFVGVGARRIRELFNAAKHHAPCIIFIDEIDAVGGKRSPKDQQHMKMTLNQLLTELDGFHQNSGIIVIGATNFPESLDKALIRPGRFDRTVAVPHPDVEGRTQILELYLKKVQVDKSTVQPRVIARGTPGFTGAELANLVNIAALKASKSGRVVVTMADLEFAKDRILMGAERKSAVISEESRRITAYHEGGHALVALMTPSANPIHKATIMPRGMALGMVMQLPEKDEEFITKQQLQAQMDICMGGRIAEEIIFGPEKITSGASSDITQATRLAKEMVTRYGMGSEASQLGSVNLVDDPDRPLSNEMRLQIEREVNSMIEASKSRARHIITTNRDKLEFLAQALLEHESLTGEEMKVVVQGKPIVKLNNNNNGNNNAATFAKNNNNNPDNVKKKKQNGSNNNQKVKV